jgi:outer membrane protein assembly factor BamB
MTLLLSACTTDWSTWGNTVDRDGTTTAEHTLSTSTVPNMKLAWSKTLGSIVYSSPVVAGGMKVGARTTDIVYLGDNAGSVVALDSADGSIIWSHNFGTQTLTGCDEGPSGVFGVWGSGVIDRADNLVFFGAADGKVHAFDLVTGVEPAGWPVTITTDPMHEYMESALTLFNGRIYVGLASHCDTLPYTGRVDAIDISVHSITHTFYITPQGMSYGGSVWGWGGVSVDPANGDVYAATGNSQGAPGGEDTYYSNSVVRLTRDLTVVSSNRPARLISDDDFGSTPVLYQRSGCPPQLAVFRKDGLMFVYDRDNIAAGPTQTITLQGIYLIGSPAYDPSTNMLYAASPRSNATYVVGLKAFQVQADCTLALKWQASVAQTGFPVMTTPTIANGVVYYGDSGGDTLHAYNAVTGQALWNSGSAIGGTIVTAPAVVNGSVYVGSYDGKVYAFRQ